jgi:GLPGLI family protein
MNKKLYFVMLLTLAVPCLAFSQNPINIDEYKVIDQSRFIITYEAMMTDDSLKPTKHNYDRLVLMVGDSISSCYSYHMHRYDSAYTEWCVHKGKDAYQNMSHFVGDSGDVWKPDVYKYYGSKRMTVVHRMGEGRVPIFLYDEPLDLMDWKMSFETKEILGYPCFKAECDFRGRHWTAWFTMQIPVQDGPWKFCGLPGLILQMEESRGHYAFRCIGIEMQQKPVVKPIVWYDEPAFVGYQRCSRADVMKQEEDYHADLIGYIRMVHPGIQIHIAKTDASGKYAGSEEAPESYKKALPYNPVELE